ncbi:hypothetical protein Btru_037642 [Bulinus truncatus]|nr:hypothetical protein Btru_037642 [Bulinus truncatus]
MASCIRGVGWEPNLYNPAFRINASTVANDFRLFRLWLKSRYPFYKSSKIIGPDVTRFQKSMRFFEPFLQANGCSFVDEISFHHYYFRDDITVSKFMDIDILDSFDEEISIGLSLMKRYDCNKPLRLTETSNSVGGGTTRLSDTFVAGFSWLDKLGKSALHGITHVFRHTFFASHYALISPNLVPNPDYYLSLMFKRYVEGPVFTIRSRLPRHIRAYANCARGYPPVSLVVYLMNLSDRSEYINFTQFHRNTLSVYTFTAHQGDLQSRKTVLNGEPLEMTGDSLPVLKESRILGDDIITPYSYAFVIATHTKTEPRRYFREVARQALSRRTRRPRTQRPTSRRPVSNTTTTTTAPRSGAHETADAAAGTEPVTPDAPASRSTPRSQRTSKASTSSGDSIKPSARATSDGRGATDGRGSKDGRGTSDPMVPDGAGTETGLMNIETDPWETASSSSLSTLTSSTSEKVGAVSSKTSTEYYMDNNDSTDNPRNMSVPVLQSYPLFIMNAVLLVLSAMFR